MAPKAKGKSKSRSSRAGLQFPVGPAQDADLLPSQLQQRESRPFLRHSPSSTEHTADCSDARIPMQQRNQLRARKAADRTFYSALADGLTAHFHNRNG
ncbi:hypothetical protein MRX96_023192 [Rhipicephalus microplus]